MGQLARSPDLTAAKKAKQKTGGPPLPLHAVSLH